MSNIKRTYSPIIWDLKETETNYEVDCLKMDGQESYQENGGASDNFNKRTLPSRRSGAGKKKARKITQLLDHYRESPHTPYTQNSWPVGLKSYIIRCFETCKNEEEKKILQEMLKEKIWDLQDYGLLLETNWYEEPVLQLTVKK